jgi:DNA processing protein
METNVTAAGKEIVRLRPADPAYPQRVLEVPGRARILRVMGDRDVFQMGPALAVVGTRNPSPEVVKNARRVVELSAEFGMVIVSGLSPGVDEAAHEMALTVGLRTIAVPGCGLEALFSSERAGLVHRILDAGGLVVSPFPGSSGDTPERRFWRNRVIAALCHGLVVVASEPGGGELEAQRWARQLERRLIEPTEEGL